MINDIMHLELYSIGNARNASLGAIAVANESSNTVSISVARSVGHVVATSHNE